MENFIQETKLLKIELLENESKYISGDLDLNKTLDKTDELYKQAISTTETTASKILHDSGLLELQTKITKQCAKAYSVNTRVFNPREFSIKVRNFFCPRLVDEEDGVLRRHEPLENMWEKLGEYSKENMYTVPNFSFMCGTFDAAPIETVKKKRKQLVKDKIGELTKPERVDPNAISNQQDVMLQSAERILSIFKRLVKKSESGMLCFYEFVVDPQSFTRTIENIFLVSLLVKEGYLCIYADEQDLPCLKLVQKGQKEFTDNKNHQSVISLSMEEWEDIVETFNYKTPLIPPKQNQNKH
ncbi:EP300-interacting inhibitor of differentiation 3 [Nephila pilipes]|uniref:Non-structural maintenance of chromosomes element 4 n=1 Tax=Nephila pilipes TaxID=299642 RepID=A0A8X6P3F7_NEPPI|nr:EP300-interacting inhibitor of differentiation 3 [Nephila pilipes]